MIHLPSGETFEYWGERLRGRPFRTRFLFTKLVEVLTYKTSTGWRRGKPPMPAESILQARPTIIRNDVVPDSTPGVVIPAKCSSPKDGKLLQRLLDALRGQKAKVIVVNDGSSFWPNLPTAQTVLTFSESRGPAAARNAGIKAAVAVGANPILMTDADCIPAPTWVEDAVQGFVENPYIHAISGKTVSHGPSWFDAYHDINGTLNGRRFKGTHILLYGPTCNFAISQTVARATTFDEQFKHAACEDIDFCYRLLTAGYRLVHRDTMLIQHDYQFQPSRLVANTVRFIRQFKRYASAEAVLLSNHPSYHFHFGQTEEIANATGLNGHQKTGHSPT